MAAGPAATLGGVVGPAQELKGMLTAEGQTPEGKQALLHAIAAAARVVRGQDAPFLGQVAITDCLGDADPCVRATAAEGLQGGPVPLVRRTRHQGHTCMRAIMRIFTRAIVPSDSRHRLLAPHPSHS